MTLGGLRMNNPERVGSSSSASINEVQLCYHIKTLSIFFNIFHKLWDDYIV